jgi:hypothetical protein
MKYALYDELPKMLAHVSRTKYGMKRSMGILDQFDLRNDFLDEWREYV